MITTLKLTETIRIGSDNIDSHGVVFNAKFLDKNKLPLVDLDVIYMPFGMEDPTNAEMMTDLVMNGWNTQSIAYARLDTDYNNDDDVEDGPDRVREFAQDAPSVLVKELREFNQFLDSVVFVSNISFPFQINTKADALRQAIDGIMFDYLRDELGTTMIIDVNQDDQILVHAIETFWEHEIGFTKFGTSGLYRSIPKLN